MRLAYDATNALAAGKRELTMSVGASGHGGVEGELNGRQVRNPVGALRIDEDAEVLQDRAVEALDQAFRLGVESCGHAELDQSALCKGCPEPACEARVSVQDDFLGPSVPANDVVVVQSGHFLGVEGLAIVLQAAARNEDGFLAQVVGDDHE
eukprot:3290274-Rhodomonas_salina.1